MDERRLQALIACGSERLRVCPLDLTYDEALGLARRYLVEMARDSEREKVREHEQAAMRRKQEDYRRTWDQHVKKQGRRLLMEAIGDFEVDGRGYAYWLGTSYPPRLLRAAKESPEAARAEFVQVVKELREEEEASAKRAQERSQRISSIFHEAVDLVIEEKAREVGMEWTAALLTSTFALPSGQRVSWGQATREQHRERMEMLRHNAAVNVEAATRHRVAIETLRETGATCLDQIA